MNTTPYNYLFGSMMGTYRVPCEILKSRLSPHSCVADVKVEYLISFYDWFLEEQIERWVSEDLIEENDE